MVLYDLTFERINLKGLSNMVCIKFHTYNKFYRWLQAKYERWNFLFGQSAFSVIDEEWSTHHLNPWQPCHSRCADRPGEWAFERSANLLRDGRWELRGGVDDPPAVTTKAAFLRYPGRTPSTSYPTLVRIAAVGKIIFNFLRDPDCGFRYQTAGWGVDQRVMNALLERPLSSCIENILDLSKIDYPKMAYLPLTIWN